MISHSLAAAETWFSQQRWQPFVFQRDVWQAYLAGESGLIHAPTGTGKTYAAWWAALMSWMDSQPQHAAWDSQPTPRLHTLWLTPMRALAADTERALHQPIADLNLPWTIERRTGDTSSYAKKRQLRKPPSTLITTPESLSLLLSQPSARQLFDQLQGVVVDEWHELLGNKRGVQAQLGLARLRRWRPELRIWGLSATLGNLDTALAHLLGVDATGEPRAGRLIQGLVPKSIVVDSLLPEHMDRFPWAGHLGLSMLPQVVTAIEEGRSALVFTNTRNQTEQWYQAILKARPDWAGIMALHHGSLAADTRHWVEEGLRAGRLRCVVCTSSLDLGVDFTPVDRVLQIGSPKGVARLLQRAGRSGHQPGVVSRVTCVPTHALELVEVAAAREAMARGIMEGRQPPDKPLDVLVQHLVTIGLGGGFEAATLLEEVRSTATYHHLSDREWEWALDFVVRGGQALRAYPEYRRVVAQDGRYRVTDRQVANRHRMSIGTIVSDPSIQVRYVRGGNLGTINESFVSRLRPGDTFIFAGRPLQFVRLREMTAWVRRAKSPRGTIPQWTGTSLPISEILSQAVRAQLADAAREPSNHPEMQAVQQVLDLQQRWSKLPAATELLIERLQTREGHHLFFYPFEGKLVHQGLAALFAFRLSQPQPITFTMTANDYGFELLSADPAPLEAVLEGNEDRPPLLSHQNLLDDIRASLNASEMAKRQFREIARVAGLIFQGYPGRPHSSRYVQASSSLFYEVFDQYDQNNLLLDQAQREVLTKQLEQTRLSAALQRLQAGLVTVVDVTRPTPLSFPLLVARMQALLSSETLADRVRRMTIQLERWADSTEQAT